jgi:signal transduction histidine kinase
MAVVLASFLVETAFMLWSDGRVAKESSDLQSTALPAVSKLTVARGTLLQYSGCLDSNAAPSVVRPCVNKARIQLRRSLNDYAALPMYPGEPGHYSKVEGYMHALDEQRTEAFARGLTPERVAAIHETLGQIDTCLRELVLLNASQAFGHAERIDDLRNQSEIFELGLGGAAVLLAGMATLLAVAGMRRHARSLEERAHELELFASTVAHDLVGPLTSVSLAVPLIQERHPDDRQTQQLGERATTGVRRVRTLVEALLEFAKSGSTRTSGPAEVGATIDSVLREQAELAQAEHIELAAERVDAGAAAVAPGVLVSILSNLVRNAIKHMGDGEPRRVVVRCCAGEQMMTVEVEDTGPGIPPESREVVFEPHVRLEGVANPGLGLGLATVKRLVVAHGGHVGVRERANGRGSVFWFELPRA